MRPCRRGRVCVNRVQTRPGNCFAAAAAVAEQRDARGKLRIRSRQSVRLSHSPHSYDRHGDGAPRGALPCTLSFVKSAVYFALRSVMSSDAPNNAGFFRPITVKAELGSILNPRSPGACAARGVTGFRVIDAITGALAEAVPERIRAPGEGGTTSYSVSGYDADGTFNMYREAVMGNWGGGAHRDGLDGVANPAANIGNAPCEVVERQAPLRIERYELVPDSGGAGQWRGGLAVMRQFRYLGERATFQLRSDRRHHRPFGVHGGLPGAASTNLLLDDGREEQWSTKFVRPLLRDQAIRHVTRGWEDTATLCCVTPRAFSTTCATARSACRRPNETTGCGCRVRPGAWRSRPPESCGRRGPRRRTPRLGRGDERRGVRSHAGRRRYRRDLCRSRGTGRGADSPESSLPGESSR